MNRAEAPATISASLAGRFHCDNDSKDLVTVSRSRLSSVKRFFSCSTRHAGALVRKFSLASLLSIALIPCWSIWACLSSRLRSAAGSIMPRTYNFTPPAVTDAAVLASKMDGVLLVVSAGYTKREHAQKAKALLEKVNARVVGAVLNNVSLDSSLHSYYADQGSV